MTIDYPIGAILSGAVLTVGVALLTAEGLARAGFPLPAPRGRIGGLDGLRGLLAVSVLVHHFVVWLQAERLGGAWAPPGVRLFDQLGGGALALFFMATGYLFYPRARAGLRGVSWPGLAIGRVFRIIPAVALSVALVVALVAVRTGRAPGLESIGPILRWIVAWGQPRLLGDPDAGRIDAYVLWSLWYEWAFYLAVLPACAAACDLVRGRLPAWVVPVALACCAWAAGAVVARPRPVTDILPLFAVGMLVRDMSARERVARVLSGRAATVAALAALAVALVAAPSPYGWAVPLLGLFFARAACGGGLGVLRTRAARVLGECSFGVYLLHGIALSALFVDAGPVTGAIPADALPLIVLPAAGVATVLAAAAAHLLVERPGMRLGAGLVVWLAARRDRRDASVPEVAAA